MIKIPNSPVLAIRRKRNGGRNGEQGEIGVVMIGRITRLGVIHVGVHVFDPPHPPRRIDPDESRKSETESAVDTRDNAKL